MIGRKKAVASQNQDFGTDVIHQLPKKSAQTITVSIPRPNIQIIILALVAVITLFQTFQLVRISQASSNTSVKAPAVVQSGTADTGNADAPQSMVGGC